MPSRGPPPLPRNLHLTLLEHSGPVHVVRYARGSAKHILSGGQDRTIRLWNPESGNQIKVYKGHGYEVLSIAVAPDNAKFASSGGDRSAFLWDVASGQITRRFVGHMARINSVEFNQDASVLASGSFDSTVRIWDIRAQSRQAIQTLEQARDSITSIHIGPVEIITGSVDGHVRSYDLRKGELRSDFMGHPVTSVLPTLDASTLLITTLDSHIRLLDRANGTVLNTFKGHANDSYRTRACFGHGEASVVCGDEGGQIWSWDLVDASILPPNPPPKVHEKVITWTEHHPNQAGELITASADGSIKIWRHPPIAASDE